LGLVDILILVVLGIFLLKGVLRGFLREVCSLLGLLLGVLLAFYLHLPLSQWMLDLFGWPSQLCVILSFALIFLLTLLIFAVLGYLLHRFVKLVLLGGVNRALGALFGVMQGVVVLALILFAVDMAELPRDLRQYYQKSQLAPPFAQLGKTVFSSGKGLVKY
jgi:membrane protein required for colicin V production